MTQLEFEQNFDHLPPRQRQVLLRLLKGETDAEIAEALEIGESAVRKNIERIGKVFSLIGEGSEGHRSKPSELAELGPSSEGGEGRRSRRAEIVALFALHQPDLLGKPVSRLTENHEAVAKQDADKARGLSGTSMNDALLVERLIENPDVAAAVLQTFLESANQDQKKQVAKTLNKLGHQSYMDGDFRSATLTLELAVNLYPDLTSANYNLGSAYDKLDQKDLAQIHFEKAAKGDDRAAQAAMNNLARLQIIQGEPQKASEQLEAHLEQVKDTAVKWAFLKNIGWAYLQQQKYAEAEKYLKEAIALGVQRPDAYCLLAQVQEKQGNQQECIELWKNCIECSFEDKNAAKTAWRFPELEVWQGEARNRLKTMP